MSGVDRWSDRRWTWTDLRLAPAAAVVWTTTLVAPLLSWPLLAGLAVGGAGAAGLLVGTGSSGRARLVAAASAALVLTAGSAAARSWAREASPLTASDGTVVLQLETDGDPRRIAGAGPPRVVVEATATRLVRGAGSIALDDAVVVFAPADGWAELLPGQVVRTRAVVSAAEPTEGVVARVSVRGPPELLGGPPWVQRAAGDLRSALTASAERTLDPAAAGLLPGLVVGDTSGLDPLLTEDFRRSGLSHLTAVSGANVAIVLSGVLAPLRRRAVDRRVQAAVAVVALVGFVLLARPTASVLRAAAMGAVSLLALASGRSRSAVPALSATVVVLLLVDPGLARDAGFALSVVATAAIVLLAPGWSRRLRTRGWPRLLADAVAVSAAAGLATAPLVAGLSGIVSLVSLPANLLAAPAVPPATVLGLLAAVAGPVAAPLADCLTWLAGWPVRWLVLVARSAAGLPDSVTAWPAGTTGALLLTGLLATVALALWRWPRLRALMLAVAVGVVLIGWPLRQVTRGWPPADAVLVACDVGQGDALVVPTGPGEGVLVDAGPEVVPVDRCLDRLGIDRLPLVLLSHLDADHVGGLDGALGDRQVGTVATGTLSPADDRADDLARTIRGAGARQEVLVPGDRRQVGPATIEVLAPAPEIATRSAEPNDLSLVARVTVRGLRILLTGDLSAQAEERLLRRGPDLRADVLKVPHHGSADNDPGFLAASGARVAIVSVGADNTYGHPTRRLLGWLEQDGMRVYRTDRSGDVAVTGSGEEWAVVPRGVEDASAAVGPSAPGPSMAAVHRNGRTAVTPCRSGRRTSRPDVASAGRRRRGGAAAQPGAVGGPGRGPRSLPRRRAARPGRSRAPPGRAGRRAGPLAVRGSPAGGGHRGARGRGCPLRRAHRLRQGGRPRPDAGRRAPRREAQRGAAQGLQGRRGRRRRVPEDQVHRRPAGVHPQRGPPRRGAHRGRRRQRPARGGGQRSAGPVVGSEPARLRLRRDDRRGRRRPVLPRTGRGQRVRRRRQGDARRHDRVARDAALGARPRGRARADRRRDRRRRAHRRPGEVGQRTVRRPGADPRDAVLEGRQGQLPGARLEHRRAPAGGRGDR
ncbi:ComEC/Rec2 family competence protein [Blastococcus sp. TF02A-26]|nr:ComEC/Rec2 family competence protein [Blastococcus sp. TF02A-26]